MTTCLFRAGPEQTFSLPEASPPAGRVQHAQYGQSAAIVIDAMDHGAVGAHHDFTGLQREDGSAASRAEGAGNDAAGATVGEAGPRSPKSLAALLGVLVRLICPPWTPCAGDFGSRATHRHKDEGCDWNDYAQRTTRYAHSAAGDRQAV